MTTGQRPRNCISEMGFLLKWRITQVHISSSIHLSRGTGTSNVMPQMALYHPVTCVSQWSDLNHLKSDWIKSFLLSSPFDFSSLSPIQQKASSDDACISHGNMRFSVTSCQLALQTSHWVSNNPVCYRRQLNLEQQLSEILTSTLYTTIKD